MEWNSIMNNLQLRELTEKEKEILRKGLEESEMENTDEK